MPNRPAIGTSPFHVKGLVYARTKSYFDTHVPGGSRALVESLEDPAVRAFFSQQFLAMNWYDALAIEPLVAAEAAITRQSVASYLRRRAAWQAEEDIKSVYAVLLRIASPDRVAAAMPRLMARIVDFGELRVDTPGERTVHMQLVGMPMLLADWYENGFTAYCERAMTLAGAKHVRFDVGSPHPTAERAGVALIELEISLKWD